MTYHGGVPRLPQPGPQIRLSLTTVQWLHVGTFVLGVLSLFLGFAPWLRAEVAGAPGVSAFEGGLGMGPTLSFVAGTLALLAVLPGGTGRPGPLVPALAVGLTLNFLFSIVVIPAGVELAAGGILATMFSVVLTATASVAYYLDVRRQRPHPAPYPPTGRFPAPPPGPFPPHHR